MNAMKKLLIAVLLLAAGPVPAAPISAPNPASTCAAYIPYGQPKSAKQSTTIVCRDGYIYEHDNVAHVPIWVAYTLTRTKVLGCFPRVARFQADPALPVGASATIKDYAKSGYDIGHMAPDGDMRWSRKAEAESANFANATPQLPGLNRAAWKALETAVRSWALERDLLIYVGPIYSRTGSTIGSNRVVVPTAFYKVLIDQKTGEVVSFIYPHAVSQKSPNAFVTSLAEVQRQAKIVLPVSKVSKLRTTTWPVIMSSGNQRAATCSIQ